MSRLRSRPAVILLVLIGVALVVLAGGRPWVEQAVTGVPGVPRVSASGSEAEPAVTALALVAAAGAVALALIGRIARRVVAGLLLLAGLGAVALVITVLRNPVEAIAPAVQAATGRTGAGGDGSSVAGAVELTAWPWLAMAGAVLIGVAAVAGLAAAGTWAGPTRRFEVAPAPTEGSEPAGRGAHVGLAESVGPVRARREQVLDDWDALSRGEDPTAG